LVALALPALIHLARRSEEKRTDFAALRWLSEKPKPRQRLRFDELPLLLLRLLLLALVALWLARPALHDDADATPWVVVAPGVDAVQAPPSGEAEVRWLAPGFPPIDQAAPTAPVAVASLLRELDAELPAGAPLTVLLAERLSGLDGERLRLSRRVEWQVRPGAMPAPRHPASSPPVFAVRFVPEAAGSLRYLRAAAVAWQPPGKPLGYSAADIGAPLPDARSVLIWLAPGALPEAVSAWIERGGTALVGNETRIDAVGGSDGALATEHSVGRGRLLQLTAPLAPSAMPQLLEPDFPRRLRELLATPPAAPASARAADVAPLTGGATYPASARELQPWLALLIGLLLLIERWYATRRARRAAP
ncbi:MAG: BatA domain-containing protein, partial [Sphingomonadaceae bacterium]|nr:BatA domain-containing protein [Sphingomonadaceae bacterium]